MAKKKTALKAAAQNLSAELSTASKEWSDAYAAYNRVVHVDVPTPEGCGTFGGAWDCDQKQLLRALVGGVRRFLGFHCPALEKVVRGEEITVIEWNHGELSGAPAADFYLMPNDYLRDTSGRYLSETEKGIVVAVVGPFPHFHHWNQFQVGRARKMSAATVDQNQDLSYYTAGSVTQRFIDELAGGQIGRTLTKSYLVGFPVCTDQEKLNAYRRVRDIYRGLTEEFVAAASPALLNV